MKKFIALASCVLFFASCTQVNTGSVTIVNSLSQGIRVAFSENYETETISLAAGETVRRDYEHYNSITFPDETPRATYTNAGNVYTIVPLTAQTLTIYVTNEYGSAVTLVNAKESDTADYTIPSGAKNLAVNLSYYHLYQLALKGLDTGTYSITTKVEPQIADKPELDKTYVLIQAPGY
jgi:hypothetical protein